MRFSFSLRFLVLFLCIRCLLDGPRPKGGRFTREFSRFLAPGLRKPRLLLLDEATASIDAETDRVIQEMVRRVFKDITVLTIAHRLNTIADSDLIIVLEQGKVAEIDAPERLLENPDSMYTALVQKSHKEHAE